MALKHLWNFSFQQTSSLLSLYSISDSMRGYCPKCKEYRSDNGKDAWKIIWKDGLAVCERCGSVIDLWVEDD